MFADVLRYRPDGARGEKSVIFPLVLFRKRDLKAGDSHDRLKVQAMVNSNDQRTLDRN